MQKLSLFLLIFILLSCSGKKATEQIPEDVMAEILADVLLTDAIKSDRISTDFFGRKDTIDFYSWAWEERGYTKADYDSTLKAYSENPETLKKLYQDVIYKLSVMQENLTDDDRKDSVLVQETLNIQVKDGVVPDQTKIYYPIDKVGRYTIKVRATVDIKDHSESPGMNVMIDDTSSAFTKNENKEKFRVYLKDGRSRQYQVSEIFRVTKPTNLIIDVAWTKNPESLEKANFMIESYEIRVRY